MHNRSIEFAKKFAVPIHVRSSFSDVPGTMITALAEAPDQAVGGAALVKNEAYEISGAQDDRIGMGIASGQLTLDGMRTFQCGHALRGCGEGREQQCQRKVRQGNLLRKR